MFYYPNTMYPSTVVVSEPYEQTSDTYDYMCTFFLNPVLYCVVRCLLNPRSSACSFGHIHYVMWVRVCQPKLRILVSQFQPQQRHAGIVLLVLLYDGIIVRYYVFPMTLYANIRHDVMSGTQHPLLADVA